MTKTELNAVREIRKRIKELEEKLQILRRASTDLVPLADGLPRAKSAKSKVEMLALKAVEAEKELEYLNEKILYAKSELADKIMTETDDPAFQVLLMYRYVECLTYREIARRMDFTLRHVFGLHEKFFRLHIDEQNRA